MANSALTKATGGDGAAGAAPAALNPAEINYDDAKLAFEKRYHLNRVPYLRQSEQSESRLKLRNSSIPCKSNYEITITKKSWKTLHRLKHR